jgi:hypothetical protein
MRKTAGYTWKNCTQTQVCKRTKYDTSFGENTEIQKKLVTTNKQNAP